MPSWPTFEKVVGSGRRESERRMGAVQQQRLQREKASGSRLPVLASTTLEGAGNRPPTLAAPRGWVLAKA